jgi:release factor glutamine methyltransferase
MRCRCPYVPARVPLPLCGHPEDRRTYDKAQGCLAKNIPEFDRKCPTFVQSRSKSRDCVDIVGFSVHKFTMPHSALSLFSPSEHTAALLLYIRNVLRNRTVSHALEIGTGSGVVLASLLAAGAKRATGVDVEALGVQETQALLVQQGLQERAQVVQGNMWQPCAEQQFDLIVTNLPQFAAHAVPGDGRLPTWSAGGIDGRSTVDLFLQDLAKHLAPQGCAVMTHNVFLDVEHTRAMLAPQGLQARVVYTASAPLSAAKLASMAPQVRERFTGRGLHAVGDFWFSDFHLLEISRIDELPYEA